MGLMKEKNEIVYINATKVSGNNVTCEKSFNELKEMVESGISPIIILNTVNCYLSYITPEIIVFNGFFTTGDFRFFITFSITLDDNCIGSWENINTSAGFNAVFSQSENGYTCNKTWSDFNYHATELNTIACIQFKYNDDYETYIPLLFGGRGSSAGKNTFYYYYDDIINKKRRVFAINIDGVTMTESNIS